MYKTRREESRGIRVSDGHGVTSEERKRRRAVRAHQRYDIRQKRSRTRKELRDFFRDLDVKKERLDLRRGIVPKKKRIRTRVRRASISDECAREQPASIRGCLEGAELARNYSGARVMSSQPKFPFTWEDCAGESVPGGELVRLTTDPRIHQTAHQWD